MRILLLEDLDTFASAIQSGLESKRRELGPVGIERVSTELEFRQRLPGLVKQSFQVAIFDVMVCWCTIEDLDTPAGQNPPAEVIKERDGLEKWRSGVRCRHLFDEALLAAGRPSVPCIFYSVLDQEDLKEELNGDTPLVVKQGDLTPLIEEIMRATGGGNGWFV